MNFLPYKNAKILLQQTGWSVEVALGVIESELKKLQEDSGSDAK